MPTCPGCEQQISYERLDAHERYCSGLRNPDQSSNEAVQRLERRLDAIEQRLERRLDAIEQAIDREVTKEGRHERGSQKFRRS